jgi:hypothetical protein
MRPGTILTFTGNGRGNVATVNVIPPVEPVRTWTVPKVKTAVK